jgi:hypothetical protein
LVEAARARIAGCEAQITCYRASIGAGEEPTVIGPWIAETQAKTAAAQAEILYDRPAIQVGRRRQRPHQRRPRSVWRNALTADSQDRCGSRSPCRAGTHAALPAGPGPQQDRLPAARRADTRVTRADAPSRPSRPGRDTTLAADLDKTCATALS